MRWAGRTTHLHEFIVVDSKTSRVKRIGIPDDEMPDERPCLAGWKVPITRVLDVRADPVWYRYDFGDDWEHVLEFEELLPASAGAYPRCVGRSGRVSARRCRRHDGVRGIPEDH